MEKEKLFVVPWKQATKEFAFGLLVSASGVSLFILLGHLGRVYLGW